MQKRKVALLAIIILILFSISCSCPVITKITELVSSKIQGAQTALQDDGFDIETQEYEETLTPNVIENWPTDQNLGVYIYDDFSSNTNNWSEGIDDNEYDKTNYQFIDDAYVWEVYAYQSANASSWPDMDAVSDFTASVTAMQKSDNYDDCDYGIIFGDEKDEVYISFTISNQDFSVYRYDETDGWAALVDWTHSDAIMAGSYNYLQVTRVGDNYTFSINGQEVDQTTFTDISNGYLGLTADVFTEGLTGQFEFDDFLLTSE